MPDKVKVRMKTIYAGPDGTCSPGKTIDLSKEEAGDLVKGGYAEYAAAVKSVPKETAVIEPPENTSMVPGSRRNPEKPHNRRG